MLYTMLGGGELLYTMLGGGELLYTMLGGGVLLYTMLGNRVILHHVSVSGTGAPLQTIPPDQNYGGLCLRLNPSRGNEILVQAP